MSSTTATSATDANALLKRTVNHLFQGMMHQDYQATMEFLRKQDVHSFWNLLKTKELQTFAPQAKTDLGYSIADTFLR